MIRAAGAALFACLAAAGCAGRQAPSYGSTTAAPTPAAEEADEHVGKRYWTRYSLPMQACDDPNMLHAPRKCFTFRGEFEVTRKIEYSAGYVTSKAYEIRIKDGRTGFVPTYELIGVDDQKAHDQEVAAKADCDRRGGVAVGMTRAQVYATCWGKPQKINSTIGSYGTHEQLVYSSGDYLYLENGILRSIQTHR